MSLLIVGGDKLGSIPNKLFELGFENFEHVSGRKCKSCVMTDCIDMVLVFTDYVGHNLCEDIRGKAKKKDVPVIFCRRSWSCIYKKLSTYGFLN